MSSGYSNETKQILKGAYQQYNKKKVSLLKKLYSDYMKLNSEIVEMKTIEGAENVILAKIAQQKSTLGCIRTEATRIPEHEIPQYISLFLASEKGTR